MTVHECTAPLDARRRSVPKPVAYFGFVLILDGLCWQFWSEGMKVLLGAGSSSTVAAAREEAEAFARDEWQRQQAAKDKWLVDSVELSRLNAETDS